MLNIGLTGGRFSGKKNVLSFFKKLGVAVYDSDITIKYLLNYNKDVIEKSNKILKYDKSFINPFTINNDEQFNDMLDIIDPLVVDNYEKFREKNEGAAYTLFSSSLLFYRDIMNFDKVINVYCPYDIRCARVDLNDLWILNTERKDDIFKTEKADYIIHNYDDIDIKPQVLNIDNKIVEYFLSEIPF